ncbi:LOW QUALITY PROTEIN: uncharacterized protein LOC141751493 [Larus michahellis]|uniref:LOW QUALITY PROTEIN: uncharacterized protein LOC141751493 n=1 Tax=Larus michahellis TaxID=119627 RepID=UPI003D9B1172
MGPELGVPGDTQLGLWPGLQVPVPQQRWRSGGAGSPGLCVASRRPVRHPPRQVPLCGWRSGARGKRWEPVAVTRCNDGLSLCFSACRRGRAQRRARVWLRAVAGTALVPASALTCALCCVVFLVCFSDLIFFFLFAHVFFFFPTISPARPSSMPLLHAPVCKLVGRVGTSPPSPACAGYVFWGERAQFGSTHSGLIHTSVTPSPSSVAGEDELGQHSVAPACSSPGPAQQDQPVVASPLSWWCPHQVPQVLGLLAVVSPAPRAAGGGLSYPFFLPPSWRRPCWLLAPMWWPVVTQSCPCSPLAGPQGAGDGSHTCIITGSPSWPLAAGTSRDMALLGAWRPVRCHPCTGFVTKAWPPPSVPPRQQAAGLSPACAHPCPGLSLVPARSSSSPAPPVTAMLTALTCF